MQRPHPMLNFLNSKYRNRKIRLIVIIATCVAIYLASAQIQLSTALVLISIALGILIHVMRTMSAKLKAEHPYRNGFQSLSNIIPIVIVITMMGYFPDVKSPPQIIALGIQVLGFIAVGFFLVSNYTNRAKRSEIDTDA